MKKNSKKTKNLLKLSPIAMVVIVGFLVTGVASAALVNYLSDKVTTTAKVKSPVEMSINEGADGTFTSNKSIIVNTTGGSDFTFTTVAKNNANNVIDGYPVIVAEAPTDKPFTGGEIDKVMFGDAGHWPEGNMLNITNRLCVVYSDGTLHPLSSWTGSSQKLVLYFDSEGTPCNKSQTIPLAVGEESWNVLTVTTDPALTPGNYKIYTQMASDLAEYASSQY